MISITVHHHSTHLAAIAANACTDKETISSSSSSTSPSYCASSTSSNLSSPGLESNVEVQYKARFFQEKEQEHSKQTIKLKQVDSNQSTETTTTSTSTTTDVNNNNNNNMNLTDSNNNNSSTSPKFKPLPEEICDEKRPINLHSRSISLVINPEQQQQQQQHQQDYSLQRLARRRSMPRLARRTRLRLATEATAATNAQHLHKQAPLEPEPKRKLEVAKSELLQPIETQPGELNSTEQQKGATEKAEKAKKGEEEVEREGEETEQEQDQARCLLKQELNETNNSSHIKEVANNLEIEVAKFKQAQSLERLRQTGVFLREISDEFAKYRRRTI